ncbi:endothelin-converting enzyme 2-like isoform X2 [Haemaphysalis longicornis]
MFVLPLCLLSTAESCRSSHTNCYSLERDILGSIDPSVHPCDDFYRHVCSGWDKRGHQGSPQSKYYSDTKRLFIQKMLSRSVPTRSTSALDKASVLLLRCLGRSTEGISELRDFLQQLQLPWPFRSAATRQELLRTLARASLQMGTVLLWAFYVGRHPTLPMENTIYMTLDSRFSQWTRDVQDLLAQKRASDYLRRCAEMVGGTGQSYSAMIEDVLEAHDNLSEQVRKWYDQTSAPRFYSLRDPELRRAVNDQLPDDSQLWPGDMIVSMQPRLYEEINATHFSRDAMRERFKHLLGAYAVWLMAPYTASDLSDRLTEETPPGVRSDYRNVRCLEVIEHIAPLAVFKGSFDALVQPSGSWELLRLTRKAVVAVAATYGRNTSSAARSATQYLALNSFNMTVPWPTLDEIYAYLPNDSRWAGRSFYALMREASSTSVGSFKASLRRPRRRMLHMSGLAKDPVYRVLFAREVPIDQYLLRAPFTEPHHPVALFAAVVGNRMAKVLMAPLGVVLFYDQHFKETYCNLGLSVVPGFRRAFGCGPQHRLYQNFTWRPIQDETILVP